MPVLDNFRLVDEVAESRLRDVVSPSQNKVLRSVAAEGGKATVFVPADSAMALVLRHRFEVTPALGELRALCADERSPPAPLQRQRGQGRKVKSGAHTEKIKKVPGSATLFFLFVN